MAVDYFLKIDGIEGESKQTKYEKQIELMSLSYDVSTPIQIGIAGGGMSMGKANFGQLHFTKRFDKSSPKIFQASCTGTHIKSAIFTAQKSGGGSLAAAQALVYFVLTIEDVVVASFANSGSGGDEGLVESVSFGYSKIKMQYTEQNEKGAAAGTTAMGWDVVASKPYQ